jgi:hypothetical protein
MLSNHAAKIRTTIVPTKKNTIKMILYVFEQKLFKCIFRLNAGLFLQDKGACRKEKFSAAFHMRIARK